MGSDRNKKGSKADKGERARAKGKQVGLGVMSPVLQRTDRISAQMSHSPSLPTYSPPPAYSRKDPLLPPSTSSSAVAVPITAVVRSAVQWTRHFGCQTDESSITLTSDGSYVHYSKGIGKAPSSPIYSSCVRKYFNADGSSIMLSREGWIQYDNGAGTMHTMTATDLNWHYYPDREGWYAYAIAQTPVIQPVKTSPQSLKHSRHDSGRSTGSRRNKTHGRGRDSDSDSEDDGYDDMYKYRGMLKDT